MRALAANPRCDNGKSAISNQQSAMTALWWTLVVVLMLAGLVGTMLPLLPGSTLIFAGAVLHKLTLDPSGTKVSWWTIGGLFALMLVSYAIDFFSGAVGAKYFGATKLGAIGGFVGAIVGMFF